MESFSNNSKNMTMDRDRQTERQTDGQMDRRNGQWTAYTALCIVTRG